MFAVIKFKNAQYKVTSGQVIKLPRFEYDEKESSIVFDQILFVADEDKVTIGEPEIKGAKVTAKILGKTRSKKVRVFKFRAKKRYKRTAGQIQDLVAVQIEKINLK